jgi:hypothetical protein
MKAQTSPPGGRKVGFAAGFLMAVFLFVALIGAQSYSAYRGTANSRRVGVASTADRFDNPMALWNSASLLDVLFPNSFSRQAALYSSYIGPEGQNREIVKNESLQIEAPVPTRAAEQIQRITKGLGGEIFKSNLANRFADKPEIALEIRVPASRFDEARVQIGDSGYRLDAEHIEVRDVGKEYVDLDATLRNEEGKESQYLSILKRASTVHDTLEVSEHLSEVRGTIEKTKGELQYLTHQIEMSALDITILGEERFGPISLHPLYRIRLAFHNAISSVVDFAAAMITIVAYLPATLLWTMSLFVFAALAWRILRWLWRLLIFKPAKTIAM